MGLHRFRLFILLVLLVLVPGNALHGQSSAAQWELREDSRVGPAGDAPGALTDVRAVAVSPNGTVVALDRSQYQVRLYDRSGRFLRAIGRRGQGPSEFVQPDRIGFRGDTLWVSDTRLNRVSLFALDGRLLETLSLSSLGPSSTNGWAHALTPEGSVVVVEPISVGPTPPGMRRVRPIIALPRRGTRVDTLHVVRTSDGARFIPMQRGRIAILDPYRQDPLIGYSPRGDLVVIVDRPIASDPNNATYGVHVIASNGKRIASRRHRYAPRPVSSADRDSVHRSILDPAHVPEFFPSEEAALGAIRKGIPTPRYWPPIRDVHVGSDSTIWLRRGPAEWLVLDRSASIVATIGVPVNIRLMAVQRSHVWGVTLDEDDLPALIRYRVMGH